LAQHIVNLGTGLLSVVNFTVKFAVPMGKEAPITSGEYLSLCAHIIAEYNSMSLPGTKAQSLMSGEM